MFVCSSEVYNKNQETEVIELCVCVCVCVRACVRACVCVCVCVRNVQLYNFIYAYTSDMCLVCTDYKLLQITYQNNSMNAREFALQSAECTSRDDPSQSSL